MAGPQQANFTFKQGSSIKVIFTVERLTNDTLPYDEITNPYIPVNLSNNFIKSMWRETPDSSQAVITASTTYGGGNGKIRVDQPDSGEFELVLQPADTTKLRFKGDSFDYYYDIEIHDTEDAVTYPFEGTITILREITR